MSIRVVIADDQALVRAGLRTILDAETDIDVVGEAADGRSAVALAKGLRPDLMLMDIRMPGMDGIAATQQMASACPGTRVVILSTFDLDEYVYRALRAGASGFLVKDLSSDQLVAAVRAAAAGDSLLTPSVTRLLIEAYTSGPLPSPAAGADSLTDREREVWRLVARGASNQETAEALYISEATVKTHVARLLMKLRARDRVQLVVLAYESGEVRPS